MYKTKTIFAVLMTSAVICGPMYSTEEGAPEMEMNEKEVSVSSAVETAVALEGRETERADEFKRRAVLAMSNGDLGEAKEALEVWMELDPESEDLYPVMVEYGQKANATDWLLMQLSKGASHLKENAYIEHQLGVLYLKQFEMEKAEVALKRAYELDSDRHEALIELCKVYRHEKNREAYEGILNQLYEKHIEEGGVEVFLGNCWMGLADWQHLYELRTAASYKLMVTDEALLLKQALGDIQKESFYEGLRALESILYANPKNATALYNFGNLLCRFRNFEEGIKVFQGLGELAPTDPRAFVGIAKAALETKDYQLGLYSAEKADELIQGQPQFEYLKANVDGLLVRYWDLL